MKKIIFLCIAWTAIALQAWADEQITFTASAQDAVEVGGQVRLTYTVNTQKVKDFRFPSNINGFEILMGPTSSRQSSMQIINGQATTTSSITYTYILKAVTEGEHSIPGATIMAEGKQYVSNALKIKVLPPDTSTGNTSAGKQNSAATSLSAADLFIVPTVSKTTVYEQEALLLTYKIYSHVNLQGFESIKLPDFKGFHSQEIELADRRWGMEHYKGRNYETAVFRQFVLFPQQSGKLSIEQARFDAVIRMVNPNVADDPLEAFFNGGSHYIEVKKTIITPQIAIDVKPLPANKPSNFSGGVGDFTVSSTISTNQLKTNDAVTVKVVISGTGNMKLINTPEVKFPEDFEVYDPKTENKFRLTAAGLTGSQVIEYLAIPRVAGNYKIPGITFSYFDINTQSYKTLTTESYELNVEKGEGNAAQSIANFTNKEDLKVLNEDIRFIKQNNVTLTPKGDIFLGSTTCWLLYLIPTALFVLLSVLYQKQIKTNANTAKVRNQKANRIAKKRMKTAEKLLKENKQEAFYDEVLKTLWEYISNKLNMPLSQLSKENIRENLSRHNVSEELIHEFIQTLDNCEFARFAPSSAGITSEKIYEASVELIGRMENSIKR
ncbi:MAG: protein BatD [Bacteroides sp.]|nr:protein BatD [Bacteroides sp.]